MSKEISARTTVTEKVTHLLWKIENFFEVLNSQQSSISGPDVIMPTQPETTWKTYLYSATSNGNVNEYIFDAKLLTPPKFEEKFEIKYRLFLQNEEGSILTEYEGTGRPPTCNLDTLDTDDETSDTIDETSYTIHEIFAYRNKKRSPHISELVVKGVLILKCCFRVIGCSTGSDVTTEASSENDLKCLSDNFRALHSSKTFSDFNLVVKDKELRVHKCILYSRSPVFAAMFKSDTLEMLDNELIKDFDFNTMEAFTLYLYTGQLSELCAEEYFHLYAASDKYALESLKKTCADKLINSITVDNVCDVYALGHYHSDPVLISAAKTYASRNVSSILTSESWTKMTSENRQLAAEMLKVAGIV